MIFAFWGDRRKALRHIRKLEAAARARAPEAPVRVIDAEEAPPSSLEAYIGAQGLFHERSLVRVMGAWAIREWQEWLSQHLPTLAGDANWFLLWSEAEPAEPLKSLLLQHAKRAIACGQEEEERPPVHAFSVARAWCEGRRSEAWAALRRAYQQGEAAEQVVGALLWQLRAALAFSDGERREVPRHALVPARAALARWGKEGVLERYRALLAAYHKSRTEEGDPLDLALELIILEHPTTL